MADYAKAKREALRAAARRILENAKRRSISARAAESWSMYTSADKVHIRNTDIGAIATEYNFDHYSWGHDPRHLTNAKNPDRTGWAERAVYEGADLAAEEFANKYIEQITVDSPYFSAR